MISVLSGVIPVNRLHPPTTCVHLRENHGRIFVADVAQHAKSPNAQVDERLLRIKKEEFQLDDREDHILNACISSAFNEVLALEGHPFFTTYDLEMRCCRGLRTFSSGERVLGSANPSRRRNAFSNCWSVAVTFEISPLHRSSFWAPLTGGGGFLCYYLQL